MDPTFMRGLDAKPLPPPPLHFLRGGGGKRKSSPRISNKGGMHPLALPPTKNHPPLITPTGKRGRGASSTPPPAPRNGLQPPP